ncbi:phage repressor protein CI [Plesiomonas shigelloides]|uniref:Uncharacterized protein n=1 Tax=Plesiomonas shigelloides 302-73 TaxID=1315976 RepID=R8ANF4_PLESH|nr:phage repressor protein CI [Plesiomonas shigelloides]EON87840.1 hypothetical protein PLESHI_14481 [Plesiomonas shigelloides 302-73]
MFEANAGETIERILQAYGFTSRLQLCNQLGISKSTLANRVFRGNFPADYVVKCSLETGASLAWLTTGHGEPFPEGQKEVTPLEQITQPKIEHFNLVDGTLIATDPVVLDRFLIPSDTTKPALVSHNSTIYLVDKDTSEVRNGTWLVDVEGIIGLKKVIRIPAGRVCISDNDGSFDCAIDEIKLIGKVKLTITQD